MYVSLAVHCCLHMSYEIWGVYGGENSNLILLGCDAALCYGRISFSHNSQEYTLLRLYCFIMERSQETEYWIYVHHIQLTFLQLYVMFTLHLYPFLKLYAVCQQSNDQFYYNRCLNVILNHVIVCYRETDSGGHPAPYPMGTRGSFPVVKVAGSWRWPLISI